MTCFSSDQNIFYSPVLNVGIWLTCQWGPFKSHIRCIVLNYKFLSFHTIRSLETAKVLILIIICPSRPASIAPCVCACSDTVINLELKSISCWPSSNIRDIKSDDKFIVLSSDSCEVFLKIISIHVFSSKWHGTTSESSWVWGCEVSKRQCCRWLEITEENWSLIFEYAGIVWVCEVFIFEDGIGTNITTGLGVIKTSPSRCDTVRMTKPWS